MILSCVPMALSSVYKEKVMNNVDMDAVLLNGYIALYQFIACIPSAIPAALAQGMAIEDIPSNTINGFKCYMGIDSVTNSTDPSLDDHCHSAPVDVSVYLGAHPFWNPEPQAASPEPYILLCWCVSDSYSRRMGRLQCPVQHLDDPDYEIRVSQHHVYGAHAHGSNGKRRLFAPLGAWSSGPYAF